MVVVAPYLGTKCKCELDVRVGVGVHMWAHARTCVCDSARARACGVSACLPGDIRGEILPVIEQVNTAEHKQGVAVCKLSEIDVGLACGGVGARSRHITRLRRRGGTARYLSRLSTPTANRSYIPAHHDFPANHQPRRPADRGAPP